MKLNYKLWKEVATFWGSFYSQVFKSLETGEVYQHKTTNKDSDKL
jgi:hypothetical protein